MIPQAGSATEAAEEPTGVRTQGPSSAELRRSAAIRVALSVLVAGALTAAAIVALWGPLSVRTDVVGYPIFADFNPYNYFRVYYLGVLFFPLAALLLFVVLTRLGPRIGLPVPGTGWSLRPGIQPPPTRPALAGDPSLALAPLAKRRAVAAARIAFLGAVLGAEVGIAADAIWLGLALGLLVYMPSALLAAAALERWGAQDWGLEERLAAVNAIAATLSVAGLIAVSANTEVRILADGSVNHYSWFPAWVGVPVTAALGGWVATAVRRAGAAAAAGIERRALILIAAPISLFLLIAILPGDVSFVDVFDGGQGLVATRLVGDGWLPWRDIVVAHGVLQDVVSPAISFGIFGDSYWGNTAGNTLIAAPLYLVSTYFLFAYLFGRNLLFLLVWALVVLGTVFAPVDFRFILWPLILLLLAAVLDRPTRLRSAGLGLLAVGQAIVTPEAAPALAVVAVVLVLYEWHSRRPGASVVAAFSRTLWFACAGALLAAVFAIYMVSRGALDDFLYVTVNLIRGHILVGAEPPNPGRDSQFDFVALAPPIALLISFAYAVVRVRLRRGFLTEDWVMAAAALFVLLYYPKFLSRMDTGHAYQPFGLALPLMLYIVYRAVTAIEEAIRDRWPRNAVLRVTAHPVSLVLVVLMAVTYWGNLRDRVSDAPARYRPKVAAAPQFDRVGYTQAFAGTDYRDLRRVVDAYLNPGDRLYDLTNEGALFFYFMDRDPSTRYFLAASVVDTAELQSDVIHRLQKAPPKLIAFDNTSTRIVGLPIMDGVPNMVREYEISQWILDRYRPLLTIHGHTFYARRGLPSPSQLDLHLAEKPVTRGVPFLTQSCGWGYAPTFLSGPGEPPAGAKGRSARTVGVQNPKATLVAWAGDPKAGVPAREVIATFGGRIVGRATPQLARPDLPLGGWPPGFGTSGVHVPVPTAALREPSKVHLFAVGRDGKVAELPRGAPVAVKGTAQIDGRRVRLDPRAVVGHFDYTLGPPSIKMELSPGSQWSDYRWLEIDAGKDGFRKGAFAVFDRQGRSSPGREISFATLDRSPHRYVVPVGSCAQWHGYRSNRLFLATRPHQDIAGVRLIR